MKNRLWLVQIPIVFAFTLGFILFEMRSRGELKNSAIVNRIYSATSIITGLMTNLKFRLRGPELPKTKVIIVDVDNESLTRFGRWPWRRDLTAGLIQRTFDAGAKVVGLDIVFSEEDRQISDELFALLKKHGLEKRAPDFETDLYLREVIKVHSNRLVLGWISDLSCQPAFNSAETCPIGDPQVQKRFRTDYEKFAFDDFVTPKGKGPDGFDPFETPVMSAVNPIQNLKIYNEVATHSGYFSVDPEGDGYIRRTHLVNFVNGMPYPSLALSMSKAALGEKIKITTDSESKVTSIQYMNSGRLIPTTQLGIMDINFRGPSYTYQYVSAIDVLGESDQIQILVDGKPKTVSKKELFKDSLAIVGISAIGIFDIRAFPFDSNTPGVEGQATILDNLMAGDMMTRGPAYSVVLIAALMLIGGLFFAHGMSLLESIPSLLLFTGILAGMLLIDLKILFSNQININSSLLYLELFAVFVSTLAIKYVLEEQKKKFIRGAFSKYVAPSIVNSILKDPTKLSVGGDRKDLTIVFSDIRGFTTFSEKMDARQLTHFLNDYLGKMTDLVFEHGGTLDKYIGDAVMAFWGAPLENENHEKGALEAAIQMQKVLSANRERYKKDYGIDVDIGIGLNTGSVSVGNMGSDRIFEYTVIGDHVNLSSRLEGLTKHYGVQILTSEYTIGGMRQKKQTPPAHRVLDRVKVKGKTQAIDLIEVFAEIPAPTLLDSYQKGRDAYRAARWKEAIEAFETCNQISQKNVGKPDGPSQLLIERCNQLKLLPQNTEWDGSWEMQSK
ncbi:MAG: adenylate/guanylate cyclase domain-containing protein [Bdellovibrionales bacterium]|nr:adenylate/guanylate cyclase domain-containing protein [Bdellovibrionales bacterium]